MPRIGDNEAASSDIRARIRFLREENELLRRAVEDLRNDNSYLRGQLADFNKISEAG
jgi:hypothetical protein